MLPIKISAISGLENSIGGLSPFDSISLTFVPLRCTCSDLSKSLPLLIAFSILRKYLTIEEIKNSGLGFLVVIGSGLLISAGFHNSETNLLISDFLSTVSLSSFSLIILLFFSTLILTELFSNAVAVSILLPIGMLISGNDMSVIMAIIFAANGSFILPYNYHTNIIIYNYGAFSYSEFIKSGITMSIIYSISVLSSIYFLI